MLAQRKLSALAQTKLLGSLPNYRQEKLESR